MNYKEMLDSWEKSKAAEKSFSVTVRMPISVMNEIDQFTESRYPGQRKGSRIVRDLLILGWRTLQSDLEKSE